MSQPDTSHLSRRAFVRQTSLPAGGQVLGHDATCQAAAEPPATDKPAADNSARTSRWSNVTSR